MAVSAALAAPCEWVLREATTGITRFPPAFELAGSVGDLSVVRPDSVAALRDARISDDDVAARLARSRVFFVLEAKSARQFNVDNSSHQLLVDLLVCGRRGMIGALSDGPRWKFARWREDGGRLLPEVTPALEHPLEVALYLFAALVAGSGAPEELPEVTWDGTDLRVDGRGRPLSLRRVSEPQPRPLFTYSLLWTVPMCALSLFRACPRRVGLLLLLAATTAAKVVAARALRNGFGMCCPRRWGCRWMRSRLRCIPPAWAGSGRSQRAIVFARSRPARRRVGSSSALTGTGREAAQQRSDRRGDRRGRPGAWSVG